ncbi:uncharacterized protein An12g10410 [Aspergillus niger]|uniref:Contig An12c0360, genomic contig n=2 Tax=Aspergillus niger TaxID=5061 RepID=A2R0Z8_ASPNC|nr:uncharacterized protein An12g10410 [Aspergillus niger]CAK41388.1 unnamed protein product [Aspergillus niger]
MSVICASEGSSPVPTPLFSAPTTPETERDEYFDEPSLPVQDDAPYVLVTGGLGYIGSHTTLELLKAGYNVIIVDDLSNSFHHVFDRILLAAKQHFDRTVESSLDTSDSITQSRSRIVGVIHFAAFKDVNDSLRNPLKYYHNNVTGLVDLVSLLADHDIKTFIFSSSANVYGTLAQNHGTLREEHCVHQPETYHSVSSGEPITSEQGCTGITNPYGRTKWIGEAILSDVAASDPSWTIIGLRYFNPIGCDPSGLLGEDPRGTPSNLVPVVVQVLTGQLPALSVYGTDWETPDGTAIRDFIHVSDVARGHTAALAAALAGQVKTNFRTFNLGTGRGHSVAEVVSAMEGVSHQSIPRRLAERRPGDVQECVAVPERAACELGWEAEKSLQDACEDLWHSLRGGSVDVMMD